MELGEYEILVLPLGDADFDKPTGRAESLANIRELRKALARNPAIGELASGVRPAADVEPGRLKAS